MPRSMPMAGTLAISREITNGLVLKAKYTEAKAESCVEVGSCKDTPMCTSSRLEGQWQCARVCSGKRTVCATAAVSAAASAAAQNQLKAVLRNFENCCCRQFSKADAGAQPLTLCRLFQMNYTATACGVVHS